MFRPEQMGVYIHWPFCKSRCPYCDFNTYVREQNFDQEVWLKAYIRVLDYYAKIYLLSRWPPFSLVGETPSLMSPEAVGRLINHVRGCWDVVDDVEVTLEAIRRVWKMQTAWLC